MKRDWSRLEEKAHAALAKNSALIDSYSRGTPASKKTERTFGGPGDQQKAWPNLGISRSRRRRKP